MVSPPQAAVGGHPRKLGTVNILISKRKAFRVIARVGAGDEWSSEEVRTTGWSEGVLWGPAWAGCQSTLGSGINMMWDPPWPPFTHLSRILFTVQGSVSLRAAAQAMSETVGIHKTARLVESKRG